MGRSASLYITITGWTGTLKPEGVGNTAGSWSGLSRADGIILRKRPRASFPGTGWNRI
jgi:hypothetical protein